MDDLVPQQGRNPERLLMFATTKNSRSENISCVGLTGFEPAIT
jgi:hypothetical protein